MPSERVLICGAGVAGSILAFWLAKHDFEVVVIERSKAEQKAGQGVEIDDPAAAKVVEMMGIVDKLKARKTGEKGTDIVDSQGRSQVLFKVDGAVGFTGSLEILRGDLTDVLYKAADEFPNVTYRFETTIQSLRQLPDKVIADTENRSSKVVKTEEFDFVIGADGVNSRTRQLIMGSPERIGCFKPVGAYSAYFSAPKEDQDWPYSRICNFPDRRVVWIRPVSENSDVVSVYFIKLGNDIPSLRRAYADGDRMKQREAFAEMYTGLGWETPRVIEQMMKTDNFYSHELMQVKLKKWSQDRVALVGDSAYAPTQFTGQGNQLAIIGGWVLAQELSRNRTPVAFENYEKRLRPHIENAQNIPLGGHVPKLFVPQTAWGIWLLHRFLSFFSLLSRLSSKVKFQKKPLDQPQNGFDLEIEETGAKTTK